MQYIDKNNDNMIICETCCSADETKNLAKRITDMFNENDVIVLSGDLGAGKTQFVQGVAEAFGIKAQIISPTFNILLEYEINNGNKINKLYHFDLYRLDDTNDLDDIGFFDIIESGGISFIEWGEKFLDEMPESHWQIYLKKIDENTREISIERIQNG